MKASDFSHIIRRESEHLLKMDMSASKMTSTDESWTTWLCDLEPEDYNFMDDINITPLPEEPENLQQTLSSGSHCSQTTSSTMSNSSGDVVNSFEERPTKILKTTPSNTGYPTQKKDPSHSYFLCFNNENPETEPNPILNIDSSLKPKAQILNYDGKSENKKKEPKRNIQESKKTDSVTRNAKDHIIAERKRREKISQQFIALSALIPDLKKMDKASVLADAITHVKQLQEQVKVLEEKNQRINKESVVYVEKTKSCSSDEDVSDNTSSNSEYGNCCHPSRSLPEVEARVSEKNVLIRIHCEKQKGVLMNIIQEIENLHLSVTSSSTLQFGTTKLDITIIAEMDEEFSLSVQELARNLQVGLLQFMSL
ncbi:transcription factor bHLH18-like [Trifolium pratense]|uniref:transcription factor bHLH18-like n=1 Tax=Trifolium pratense TaxID=57577 RepID=UPI001E6951C7|nr:transcription factor bHLH18-like [Trifolium pratense]